MMAPSGAASCMPGQQLAIVDHGVVRAGLGHERFERHRAQRVHCRDVLDRLRNERAPQAKIRHAAGPGHVALRRERLGVLRRRQADRVFENGGHAARGGAPRAGLEALARLPRLTARRSGSARRHHPE